MDAKIIRIIFIDNFSSIQEMTLACVTGETFGIILAAFLSI